MPPTVQLGKAKVERTEPLDTKDAKWLTLSKLHWKDETGKDRVWESAGRATRGNSGVDAVAITPLLSAPGKPLSTIIVLQFRPPTNNVVVEFPAGLIDKDETPAQSALRELYEETGYGKSYDGKGSNGVGEASIEDVSVELVNDPGMSSANMVVATVNVKLESTEDLVEPEPNLDAGEHIEKKLVAVSDLYKVLNDYSKKGYSIDARLFNFAWGIELAQRKF